MIPAACMSYLRSDTLAGQNVANIKDFVPTVPDVTIVSGWTLKHVALQPFNCPTAQNHHRTSPGSDWCIILTQRLLQRALTSSSSLSSVLETLWVTLIVGINFDKCSPQRRINTLFPAVINTFEDFYPPKQLKTPRLWTEKGERSWEKQRLKRSHRLWGRLRRP